MEMHRRTPLWLSHHYPHQYHRCIRVGEKHICRRCSVFYPVAFAVTLATLAGLRWPEAADVWLLWLLPVPVVLEWYLEHLGMARYSAWRNTSLTLLCAPAVGVGLARYLRSPGDTLFWVVVATYAVICITAVVMGRRRCQIEGALTGPRPERATREALSETAAGSVR